MATASEVRRDDVKLATEYTRQERFWMWIKDNIPSFIRGARDMGVYRLVRERTRVFPRVFPIVHRFYEVTFLKSGETTCVLCVHSYHTAWRIMIGMLIAGFVGIAIGIAMGRVGWFEKVHDPHPEHVAAHSGPGLEPDSRLVVRPRQHDHDFHHRIRRGATGHLLDVDGGKTINPIWIRAAQSMNAEGMDSVLESHFSPVRCRSFSRASASASRAHGAPASPERWWPRVTGAWATPSSTAAKTSIRLSCWWESRPSPWSGRDGEIHF